MSDACLGCSARRDFLRAAAAAMLAGVTLGPLGTLHALEPDVVLLRVVPREADAEADEASVHLLRVQERLARDGARVQARVVRGDAAEQILAYVPAARPDYPGVGFWLGRALRRAWDHVRGADPERTSYLRRALRPNELFLAHPASEAAALRAAFGPRTAAT